MLEVDTDNFEHNARGCTRTMLGVDMDNFLHNAGGWTSGHLNNANELTDCNLMDLEFTILGLYLFHE